jgi:TP901 family phage tail tape measure protein
MADTVFRVQVGAQIQTSTVTLRSDIQNILNDIGKNNPPKITVGLAKTATKTKLTADLNDLLTKQNIGITLGLKGGGSLRGSSGAKITKELIDITSQLSQNQAAKITLHLNTAATQKAMLAELKKLDLGVNITPRENKKKPAVTTPAKYGPAWSAEPAHPTAQAYVAAGEAAKNIAFQVQAAAGAASLLRQALLGVAQTPQPDYTKVEAQATNIADETGRWAAEQQAARKEYEATVQKAATLQKSIYDLQRQQLGTTAGSEGFAELQRLIDQKQTALRELTNVYLQSDSAQRRGDTAESFAKETEAVQKVTKALEAYAVARAKANANTSTKLNSEQTKLLQTAEKYRATLNKSTTAATTYESRLDNLVNSFKNNTISADEFRQSLDRWKNAAKSAGAMAESAGQKFSRMLGDKIGYGAIALALMKIRQALGQVYTNVVNLDTAMTELKKVTDETDETYRKFLTNAASRARALGATITDTVNATASFARLGYGIEDASKLADAAVVYKHVGDEIESIDEASNSVISTMQAFGVEASNVMSIVDKFNQIGNKFAISSGGVGEAMQRSAAAMQAAGNTIDETLALIAAMNTVVQNPESVGTTLKTVSMYLRAAKTEAEAAGESTDGMADSVSKLRAEIKALTGNKVDIMLDEDTFKSSYQILKELSRIWDHLSDVSQANILEKLAGKRNANALVAVINNFDIAEQALKESQKSAGSALQENEKYLDSINGKLDKLKASWEKISNSLLGNGVVKSLIDALRTVLDFFNKLDEVTGGWSSRIIAFLSVVGMASATISAFKFKAQDATSLLGSLVQAFSKGNIFATFGSGIAAIGTKLKDVAAAFQLAAGAGAKDFIPTLWSLIPGAGQAAIAIGLVAGAIALVVAGYKAYRKSHPTFDDLRQKAEDLQQDVDDLSSSIETANERIKELQQLADNGTISLVEQDELDRLKDQNELLQAQLELKQALLDSTNQQKASAARGEYDKFFKNQGEKISTTEQNAASDVANNGALPMSYVSNAEESAVQKFDKQKADIIEYDRQIRELTASMAGMTEAEAKKAEKKLQDLNDKRADALTKLGEIAEPLQEILSSLDPEVDADKIQQIKILTYQIEYLSGDAAALQKIWDSVWNDEDANSGIKKLKSDLESAATAQAEFNEELKQYQSNVDMTNRPHIEVTQDMVNTGMWDKADIGKHSTVNSFTFTAKEFGSKSTQAILVTPILPDGTYFNSQYDLEKYLATLMDGNGKFDVAKDTKGIVMGIFDKGSVDESVQEADRYAEAAHNVNAAFDDLLESDVFQRFKTEMEAIGYDMSNVSAGDLAKMFEQLPSSVDPATESLTGLATALSALEAKASLIKSAQKELSSSGSLSVSTLSSIVEKFPALEEDVSLYIAGMKTGKELISDLSAAYQSDTEAYKANLAKKLAASPEFFKNLTSDQKQLISDLADSYNVDLGNFKTVEQAKLNFQAEIIKKLAINYRQYSGMTLEQLKDQRKQMNIIAANADLYRSTHGSAFVDSTLSQLAAVNQTIKSIEDGNARLDSLINTNLEGWSPSKYSDKSKSSSSSNDAYKTSVQEKIDLLKHQLQMEQITAEQYYDGLEAIEKKYYKDSKAHMTKYASEIRSIDEELFSGRRQLAESWLQAQEKLASKEAAAGNYAGQQNTLSAMLDKVKQIISDAYAYGLTEASDYVQTLHDKLSSLQDDLLSAVQSPFEKYISYMDDFDLWDDIAVDSEPVKKMANSLQDVSKILGTIPVEKAADAMQKFAGGTDDATKSMKGLISELGKLSKLDTLKLQLQAIDHQYQAGLLSWDKYVDAHNKVAKSIYDTQRNSLQTILDLTMKMIKQEAEDQVDAIEKQEKAYKKIIDLKKQLLQDSADEDDHEEQVAEKVKEIADLQSKIAQLSLDDSREAAAKRASLAEELQQKQKELADLQKDYALDQTIDTLDKSQEAFEDEKDAEKDAAKEAVDSWQKLYEKAIKRINGDWDGLYKDLMKYEQEHRDSIDGPDSLVSAWHSATSAMKEYNNSFEDAYKNAPNDAINPNAPQSPEAQAILKKMKANSDLAKSLGTSRLPDGRNLHDENNQLAAQYYALTGQKLVYNNGWRLDHAYGDTAYDVTAKPSTSTQSKPQGSSGGRAYEATVEKYSSPPSGTLKEGSTGAGVKWLQYYLKQLGLFPYDVDGQFYSRTKNALKQFQRMAKIQQDGIYGKNTRAALPRFHTGGIVGNSGAINDHEVLALLKKGEWVLDDTRKRNLKEMFSNLKMAASGLMSSTAMSRMQTMRPATVTSGGDTFAPHIEVSIQHNGQMTDKDARQYGSMVANTALEQLRTAFVKRGKA